MLSIAPPAPQIKTLTPNLLPCSIKHSGPIGVAKRYWDPQIADTTDPAQTEQNKTSLEERPAAKKPRVSYLRGRKLLGRTIALPAGYTGVVVQKTGEFLPPPVPERQAKARNLAYDDDGVDESEAEDEPSEVEILSRTAEFHGLAVWGHESVPTDEDPYVKGVEEWIAFAEKVR